MAPLDILNIECPASSNICKYPGVGTRVFSCGQRKPNLLPRLKPLHLFDPASPSRKTGV